MAQENRSKKAFNKRIIIGLLAVVAVIALALAMAKILPELTGVGLPTLTDPPDVLGSGTGSGASSGSTLPPQTDEAGTTAPQHTGATDTPAGHTRRAGVYTILLIGMDQQQSLSDVLMLVTYDTANATVDVLQIPRDTYSNYLCNGSTSSIHNINRAIYRGGIDGLEEEIKHLIGFGVDYYVSVNMDGFKKIVNKMGGIQFDLPRDMDYDDPFQDLHIHLKKGYQTFNGTDALALMRYRSGYYNADVGRVEMRSKFLKAAASQLLSTSNAAKVVELAGTLFDNTKTDLTLSDLQAFAKEALKIKIDNVNFHTLPGTGVTGNPYWWPYEKELLTMINDYFNPYNEPITYIDIAYNDNTQGK